MGKKHIALVGGQPLPVYLGIVNDEECDEIILVHSERTLGEAETIVKNYSKKYSCILCDPTDIPKIQALAKGLRENVNGHEVTLNLTSGTKPWSLLFYQQFVDYPSVQFVYIDQLNNWYDLKTGESKTLNVDMFKRFELYGTPLKKYIKIEDYTKQDCSAISSIEKARYANIYDFTDLTNRDVKDYEDDEGEVVARNGSKMTWNWSEGWVEFDMVRYNGNSNTYVKIELDHPKELVLHSSWFELKTALDLSKNRNIKEIYLNCEFPSKEGDAKNEIDIIADFGTRLLFVECKTMVNDITAIDKFRSAMRNYSGTSSTGIFVTNDKVGNKQGKSVVRYQRYIAAMEKCRDNDMLAFNFGLWDKRPETSLNSIVNNAIDKINKR